MEDVVGLLGGVATGGISSVLGGLLGGLARLATAWLAFKTQERDQLHEREMTKLLTEREEKLADLRVKEATVAGDLRVDETWAQALREAVAGKPSGVPWVDALAATVRPVITYWWQTYFTIYKVAVLSLVAMDQGWKVALAYAWTSDDQAILSAIIAFWFLDRTLQKKRT